MDYCKTRTVYSYQSDCIKLFYDAWCSISIPCLLFSFAYVHVNYVRSRQIGPLCEVVCVSQHSMVDGFPYPLFEKASTHPFNSMRHGCPWRTPDLPHNEMVRWYLGLADSGDACCEAPPSL